MDQFAHLEQIWDQLLSREPERIRSAYALLDESSQQTVLAHLRKMVSEPGWQAEQVTSAAIALQAITG
jgi:hypothetical protein